MTVWQETMIRLARSEKVTAFAQRQSWLSGLAGQFVGGDGVEQARQRAADLADNGIAASLFFLGEYVSDPVVIARTVAELTASLKAAAASGLDACASVDPTQIGLMVDPQTCLANARALAQVVSALAGSPRNGHDVLMIDMEDAGVTGQTLDLYWQLRGDDLPVAVTIQSYLHRSQDDLARLIAAGAWVRLVKGAFAEPAGLAVRSVADRDSRYRQCVARLLSRTARESGVYPAFATHDHRIIEEIIAQASAQGWPEDSYEFEMLFGVRAELQRELVRRGHRVRVYLPFGQDWFPYAIRRVGESPQNLRFAVSALGRTLLRTGR